jgi:hypothetical protein
MTFHDGDRFVVLRDLEAICVIGLSDMFSDVQKVPLRSGEVVILTGGQEERSRRICCRPYRYETLEPDLVDDDTRQHPGYRGYHLLIDKDDIQRDCKPFMTAA